MPGKMLRNTESPLRVARAFVEAINHRNVEELAALMTEDHVFMDGMGTRYEGRETMRAGWEGYFRLVPDYQVVVEEAYVDGAVVVLLGMAGGTYAVEGRVLPENRWQTPAAWRARIRGGLVAGWRVYTDNEPLRRIMEKNRA
ncbi:MAG: nuclear transport factor 2 family protein [Bryobacteraceae bacterium]|jgi:ketosteroid isomerase-like protein